MLYRLTMTHLTGLTVAHTASAQLCICSTRSVCLTCGAVEVCAVSSNQAEALSRVDCCTDAGWDLACKLMRRRNALNRGRLSAGQALRHRFLLPLP